MKCMIAVCVTVLHVHVRVHEQLLIRLSEGQPVEGDHPQRLQGIVPRPGNNCHIQSPSTRLTSLCIAHMRLVLLD